MAYYTPSQIKDFWIQAGGNPQYADEAAKTAFLKSGGNDSAPGGLWGINSSPNVDAINSARTAIAASNNGQNLSGFSPGPVIPGVTDPVTNSIRDFLGSLFGTTGITDQIKFVLMIVAGAVLMLLGVLIMVAGTKPVKAAGAFALSSILGGAGFGLGANVTAGKGTRAAIAGTAGGEGGEAAGQPVEPVEPPPTPSAGSVTPPRRGRTINWTAPTRESPKIPPSKGGPVPGPLRRQRIRQPVSEAGPLFTMKGRKVRTGGRHRAGE